MVRDPDSYSWKTSRLAANLRPLVDALAIKRLVGGKYGGSVAVECAASKRTSQRAWLRAGADRRGVQQR
jgi:hypothetical protein